MKCLVDRSSNLLGSLIDRKPRQRPFWFPLLFPCSLSRFLKSGDVADHLVDVREAAGTIQIIESVVPRARPGLVAIQERALVYSLHNGVLEDTAVTTRAVQREIAADRGQDLHANMAFKPDVREVALPPGSILALGTNFCLWRLI